MTVLFLFQIAFADLVEILLILLLIREFFYTRWPIILISEDILQDTSSFLLELHIFHLIRFF